MENLKEMFVQKGTWTNDETGETFPTFRLHIVFKSGYDCVCKINAEKAELLSYMGVEVK